MVQYNERLELWREKNNITVGGAATTATVPDLVPFTEYQFHLVSINNIGAGPPSPLVTAVTQMEGSFIYPHNISPHIIAFQVPSGPPQSVRVEAISGTELRVTWQVSIYLVGDKQNLFHTCNFLASKTGRQKWSYHWILHQIWKTWQ